MNNTTQGWIIFIAALGMMLGLLSVDISHLKGWDEIKSPGFVSSLFAHMGVVIAAFIGGKLIPASRDHGMKTRSTDPGANK